MQRLWSSALPVSVSFLLLLLARCGGGKIIRVSANGNNSRECWEGNESTPCLSLDYALGGLVSNTTNVTMQQVTIQVNYSHAISDTSWTNVTGSLKDVAILGVGRSAPVINCTSLGVGIAFWGQDNVTISGLSWLGCSVRTPTATVVDGSPVEAYRALFFFDVTNLTIEDCTFSSEGRGGGVALYDVAGDVRISNSQFLHNTVATDLRCHDKYNRSTFVNCSSQAAAVYIELTSCRGFTNCTAPVAGVANATYTISHCLFQENHNFISFSESFALDYVTHSYRSFGFGGGVALSVVGRNQGNLFRISNSQFINNTAYSGGGLFMLFLRDSQENILDITNVQFTGNKADELYSSGGGVLLASILYTQEVPSNAFFFQNVKMVNNHGKYGGGMGVYFGNYSRDLDPFFSKGLTLDFVNCTWESNSALQAGAAVSIFHFKAINSITTRSTIFTDCTFVENFIPRVGGRTERNGFGTIHSEAAPISFNGTTLISRSISSAVVATAARVSFAGNVVFSENQGFVGSAIYLMDVSVLYLYQGLNMTFVDNDAFDTGAAIHYVYTGARGLGQSCFFQYENHTLPPSQWNVSISFRGNRALYGGNAIYLSDPPGCTWTDDDEFLFDMTTEHPLNFSGNDEPIMGTPATNLTFLPPVNFTDGSYQVTITPGQMLHLPVKIQDYFNSSSVTATLDTKCINQSLFDKNHFFDDLCAPGSDITYEGPRVFVADSSISGIRLGGPQNNSDLVLVLKTIEAQAIVTVLKVSFSECSYGFYFDNATKTCKCYDDDDAVRCFSFNGTDEPCILKGHWYGTIETSEGTSHAESSCTLDSCSASCKQSCLNIHGWCKLPEFEHQLCTDHHDGPLCAYCSDGYSPNYGKLHCVSNDECNAGTSVLLVLLMVVFWAVIIVTLLIILRLNMRLGSGFMYGFIYYFSVLPFIAGNIIGNHAFSGFVSFFYSLVHLDPHFLSFFKLCFARDITPVQLEFFHYFHPLLVSVMIFVILLLNRYCPKVPVISVYAPVHALCLILLLSYTSLFQTSFSILQPLRFSNARPETSELFVRLQPRTAYFDPGDHLPYAMVALAVELFLVLPFTVIMLLAPWLMRWSKMIKVKPILDEFQSCYKDRYRWFAGYYLLCRQLLALPPFFINAPSGSIFFQQILNITILLIHSYVQPYRERWLNLLDTVFLFDLALVSILSGDTAQNVFSGAFFDAKLVFKIILITIPCLYIALACVVVFGIKFHSWYQSKYKISSVGDTPSPEGDSYQPISDRGEKTKGQGRATVSVISFPLDTDSREENPLLNHETETFTASITAQHLDQDRPTTTHQGRGTTLLRRLASGLSSQVSYWRNTGGTSSRDSYNGQELPDLREHETFT